MYYYLYDNFLSAKKYQSSINKIESRLTDLGINGKISHLSFLKNIKQILTEEIKHGIKTIIVVGNDRTVNQVINLLPDFNALLGIIPLGPHNQIAKLLNIPEAEAACDVLSARMNTRLNLGLVNNNYYFITSLELLGNNLTINCDNNYLINLDGKNNSLITINNLFSFTNKSSIEDTLRLTIKTPKKLFFLKSYNNISRLQARKINLSSKKSIPILITDEKRIIKTPIEVVISPKKLKIIIGKIKRENK